MKLVYFDDSNLGVLEGDMVVDVMDVVKDIPHIRPDRLFNIEMEVQGLERLVVHVNDQLGWE